MTVPGLRNTRLPVHPPALRLWSTGGLVLGALALAYGVVIHPPFALLAAFIAFAVTLALANPDLVPRLFVWMFGGLLLGYAFFGRAFAHLGVSPVFVGEVVLAAGLLSLLTNRNRWAAFRSPIAWAFLIFAAWEAACAIPYFRVYGLDTLRDSALWGYGVFLLLLPAALAGAGWIPRLLQQYWRWMPLLVLWIPVGLVLSHWLPQILPVHQGSGEPMSLVRPSHGGVHLAGAATFMLLGLHRAPGVRPGSGLIRTGWLLSAACALAFMSIGVVGRGGALAALVGILAVVVIRPMVALSKTMLVAGAAVAIGLALLAMNVTFEMGARDFSTSQLTRNLESIVSDVSEDQPGLEKTQEWRLRWWRRVLEYTIHGPYFWSGKGFGVNLAVDDGVKMASFNRSPHNAHMTVLARSGVPGATLWLLLQALFGASMLVGYSRARRRGREWWARLHLWILAYWLAALTAMSFGVYLEGPYGGVWFWSLMGLGVAVLLADRQSSALPDETTSRMGHPHEAAARP